MKKKLFITLLVFLLSQTAHGLILGPPLVAECPKCEGEKWLLSMVSGNTFGAVQWSDLYLDAIMMPRLSPVLKCPHCETYYILEKAKIRTAEEGEVSQDVDTGRLSFEEMKEAMCLLKEEQLTEEEEYNIRLEFLHRYNDAFREYDDVRDGEYSDLDFLQRNQEDSKLHLSNLKALIGLLDDRKESDMLLKAELYREGGNYKKCLGILERSNISDEYMQSYAAKVRERAEMKDDKVFLIDY